MIKTLVVVRVDVTWHSTQGKQLRKTAITRVDFMSGQASANGQFFDDSEQILASARCWIRTFPCISFLPGKQRTEIANQHMRN